MIDVILKNIYTWFARFKILFNIILLQNMPKMVVSRELEMGNEKKINKYWLIIDV